MVRRGIFGVMNSNGGEEWERRIEEGSKEYTVEGKESYCY